MKCFGPQFFMQNRSNLGVHYSGFLIFCFQCGDRYHVILMTIYQIYYTDFPDAGDTRLKSQVDQFFFFFFFFFFGRHIHFKFLMVGGTWAWLKQSCKKYYKLLCCLIYHICNHNWHHLVDNFFFFFILLSVSVT